MSSKRYVQLPLMKVGLGQYARAWKAVKECPPSTEFRQNGFDPWTKTAGWMLGEFRKGMHDRINQHVPGYGCGRKWDSQWQRETMQAAIRLNTPRRAIRETELPLWLRARFGHRTYGPGE